MGPGVIPRCKAEGMATRPWGFTVCFNVIVDQLESISMKSPRAISAKTEGGCQTPFIVTGREAKVSQALDGVVKRPKVPINSVAVAHGMQKASETLAIQKYTHPID